jgi:hypothetical protein
MSTLTKNRNIKATDVWFSKDMLIVRLDDGREIGTPLEWFPKLRDASDSDRKNWRFIGKGIGIHWEKIDEDISINGLLK